MFPNPQDALPLPRHANVEQYHELADELVKACMSSDPAAVRQWAARWIERLAALPNQSEALRPDADLGARVDQVEQFARQTLAGDRSFTQCALSDARLVIVRSHGFPSWPVFVEHIESLARAQSPVAAFERAADAIVTGDIATLERLLHEHPDLIRARSQREHRATLLHYVSANGVENYRQMSPGNIAAITRLLLVAGAEVDAGADVYGGGCTALGLVATSAPPSLAGVQQDVIDVLLEHGAAVDGNGAGGGRWSLVRACLANGQPRAAGYLASRGAPVDLAGAAGLGRTDIVKRIIDGRPQQTLIGAEIEDAFALACAYGRTEVIALLLGLGFDVDHELKGHGDGHTGLHVAAYHGHDEAVDTLLRSGARVDAIDKTWRTPPLIWALTGWSREPSADAVDYRTVVARLVGAGAAVNPDLFDWDRVREDPGMLAALRGRAAE